MFTTFFQCYFEIKITKFFLKFKNIKQPKSILKDTHDLYLISNFLILQINLRIFRMKHD